MTGSTEEALAAFFERSSSNGLFHPAKISYWQSERCRSGKSLYIRQRWYSDNTTELICVRIKLAIVNCKVRVRRRALPWWEDKVVELRSLEQYDLLASGQSPR